MAVRRSFASSRGLRIALPTLVIAALGAGAMYLGAPPTAPAEAEDLPLVTTGSTSPVAELSTAEIPTAVVSPMAATNSEGDCPLVNTFTLTITAGSPTCDDILKAAGPYTAAVLAPDSRMELGRELAWSDGKWNCSRNYDQTGQTMNAHGLACSNGASAFLLVSE